MRIYNLFPRYFESITEWTKELERIKLLGFDTIYINPFHYRGFSGSLYAVKDYYTIDPSFVDHSMTKPALEQLQDFIQKAHDLELKVLMDLVINHSGKDCILVGQHPDWYLHKNGQLQSPGAWENDVWISWGDLAQFDLYYSSDKENLWNYFKDLILFYLELGFDGFRADAAYQVPSQLWKELIGIARLRFPESMFIAESLGGSEESFIELSHCGFNFLFNSAKWWNFHDDWFIEQYNKIGIHTRTIGFAESHDTERIAHHLSETEINRILVFTGLISSSWMILSGTEFGWKQKPNVVTTSPKDKEDCGFSLVKRIQEINKLRDQYFALNHEGQIQKIRHDKETRILILEKKVLEQKITFVINKFDDKSEFSCKKDYGTLIYSTHTEIGREYLSGSEVQVFIS